MAPLLWDTKQLAGYLEGEGCFSLDRNEQPFIAVQTTDVDVAQSCKVTHGEWHYPIWTY